MDLQQIKKKGLNVIWFTMAFLPAIIRGKKYHHKTDVDYTHNWIIQKKRVKRVYSLAILNSSLLC